MQCIEAQHEGRILSPWWESGDDQATPQPSAYTVHPIRLTFNSQRNFKFHFIN